MHGIDTYIAEAASPTGKAVLMIPDVYGESDWDWDVKTPPSPSTSADPHARWNRTTVIVSKAACALKARASLLLRLGLCDEPRSR